MNTPGSRLREARKRKGLTQLELANRLGCMQGIISRYEQDKRGKNRPDIHFYLKLVKELEVSLDWIFLGKEGDL